MTSLQDTFTELERNCLIVEQKNKLLWPNTEINTIQEWIKDKYGVIDDINLTDSRPYIINEKVKDLLNQKKIEKDFSILDICCGDALILQQIKQKHSSCSAFGIDINKNKINSHKEVQKCGVNLFFGYIQQLFITNLPVKIDVAVMLNTFRAWDRAQLKDTERELPKIALNWIMNNCRYFIATMTEEQFKLIGLTRSIEKIGIGEQNSIFAIVEL